MKNIAAFSLLFLFNFTAHSVNRSFTNEFGGSWHIAANWSPNGVPGISDTANLTMAGTYTVLLTNSVDISDMTLGNVSGTQTLFVGNFAQLNITNNGTVQSSGILSISSAGLQGMVTVQSGGQLSLDSSAVKNFYNLTLFNQGIVNWNGGNLICGGTPTTVISNGGLWQVTFDNGKMYQYFGGPPMVWINEGTLLKNAGTGVSYINDFQFQNISSGVVQVTSGTLQFTGNATNDSVIGGSFNASGNGAVNIFGGMWTDAGGAATGTNRFTGGTFNLRTNTIPGLVLAGGNVNIIGTTTFQQGGAITNLTLDGPYLHGTNRVGNGALTINAGGADGQLTVQSGGQLNLNSAVTKFLTSLTLINQGTVIWNGGTLFCGRTPATVISNGGIWQVTFDNGNMYRDAGGGPPMFWTNSGTLLKSAGTGYSYISDFNMFNVASGVIEAASGTLQLPPVFTNTAGTLRLSGGSLQGGGTLTMIGGTLQGSGSLGFNLISNGTVSPGFSPGRIGFTSSLNLRPGATVVLEGAGTVPGSGYDQLSVTGLVALNNCTLQVTSLPPVEPGTTFVIIQNDSIDPVQGTFNNLAENAQLTVSGQSFRIHYTGGDGNDVTLVRDSDNTVTGPQLSADSYNNGTFHLFGAGSSSVIYAVQATTNFLQWTNIGTTTSDLSGNFNFLDTNASKFRQRFYRTTN
jgi:hypothetical protein